MTALADLLAGARRPAIVAGRGAVLAGAGPALRALGELTGAVLATSAVANGLFAGDPYDLGISGGFASPLAAQLLGEAAQDKGSLGGKILRMTTTGRTAPGNPFGTLVWSYGHRNVQGIAWDADGRMWASEFGDHSEDELNLIERGHNYGWPQTEGETSRSGVTGPVAQWGPSEDSPSGIAVAGGSVWMAALRGERLWRVPLDGARVRTEPEDFLVGRYGRLRSVMAIDDGTLLLTTSNRDGRQAPGARDDRILLVARPLSPPAHSGLCR